MAIDHLCTFASIHWSFMYICDCERYLSGYDMARHGMICSNITQMCITLSQKGRIKLCTAGVTVSFSFSCRFFHFSLSVPYLFPVSCTSCGLQNIKTQAVKPANTTYGLRINITPSKSALHDLFTHVNRISCSPDSNVGA